MVSLEVLYLPSFDVVSRTDLAEVGNAIGGATREIGTRYDFKGSKCSIEHVDTIITVNADDDFKLKQVCELLKGYMAKRKFNISAFEFGKPEKASGNSLRQTITIKLGIDRELAQQIVKAMKSAKLKVQTAIQGDELRISGKKRDVLQDAITLIKELKISHPLQYVNFRD